MLNEIDLSRADLNLLVVFEAVLAEGHVGRAGERLALTPSAVSHSLGRLRVMLGDPLFLRTPRGVTPTARARELAGPIADILARVRTVVASAAPFDPALSKRRFVIGAPDGVSAVLLPPLIEALQRTAPGVDIGLRQLLPRGGEPSPSLAWSDTLTDLEARAMDIAIAPIDEAPARFEVRTVYEEDFVIATRARHPFARMPTLQKYCAAEHLVVSESGDAFGFVDAALAERKLARRVALTAPNFMFALSLLADSDLIAALPRRFVANYGSRFGVRAVEAPVKLPRFKLNLIVPKVALNDAGVAWLAELLAPVSGSAPPRKTRRPHQS